MNGSNKVKHYCGVVGIQSVHDTNIPEHLFFPLFSLQHRGQESCGIAYRKGNETVVYKDIGMVSSVLQRYLTSDHPSRAGIGHVRYSTHGGKNKIENAQPIHVTCNKGEIALAHNGNISNTDILKKELVDEGSIFQSTSDTELILHMISRSRADNFDEALRETLCRLEGAFSMVMMHEDTLYAIRDPWGYRPLVLGRNEEFTVAASETCALDILGISEYHEIKPGQIVKVSKGRCETIPFKSSPVKSQCIFELIYFSRPDSIIYNEAVYNMRKRIGAALAEQDGNIADVVVPVPDSGNSAALGYAERAGISFELGLTRNHYAGRSFIMPTTSQRELAVRMKLHPIKSIIHGKRIVLVDDSLVRGTTSKILVKLLRETGAAEIHLRLSSPEIKWPCYFGIDIPTREELISNRMAPPQIADFIEADSVRFLDVDLLKESVKTPHEYCYGCFCGKYAVAPPGPQEAE